MTAMQSHASLQVGMPDKMYAFGDDVTTLMFRRVPRKYSAMDMLSELEHHVSREYLNFVYVPWESSSASNMGFAFVNFVDSQTTRMVFAVMDGTLWKNAIKPRETWIVPAIMQGLGDNLMRYHQATAGRGDLKHSPLVFHKGQQIPLQLAIEMFCRPHFTSFEQQSWQGLGDIEQSPVKTDPAPASLGSWSTHWTDMGEHSSNGERLSIGSTCGGITFESDTSSPRVQPPPGLSLPTDTLPAMEQKFHTESPITFDYYPKYHRQTNEPALDGIGSTRHSGVDAVLESPGYAAACSKVNYLLAELTAAGGPMSFKRM